MNKWADIWAFGVVLFEMLSGLPLFASETVSDTLAAVLKTNPNWTALPPDTPANVRRLLERCLDRDPRQRLHDFGDARLELQAGEAPLVAPPATAGRSAWLAWGVAVVAILASTWALWTRGAAPGPSRPAMYVDFAFPAGVEPLTSLNGGFAASPDGMSMAMIGVRGGARRLFLRALDRPEAVEIPDTQGVNCVTFSPDGGSLAFTVIGGGNALVRLSLADRERRQIAAGVDQFSSIAWGPSGIIYVHRGSLWIVPAPGGSPRALTTLDAARNESHHTDPLVLPGGRTILFSSLTTQPGTERIEAVPISGGPRTVVLERAMTPIWSPTGHLLFSREGAVLAAAFDADRAALSGAAVPVIPDGVIGRQRFGTLGLLVSPSGTLAYLPANPEHNRVVLVGRDGSALGLGLSLPPARYAFPRLSPDGRRLVIESSRLVLEVLDLGRGTRASLTSAALGTNFPSWNSGGDRVVFRRYNWPFWVAADGSGKEGPVPAARIADYPTAPTRPRLPARYRRLRRHRRRLGPMASPRTPSPDRWGFLRRRRLSRPQELGRGSGDEAVP